MNWEPFLLNFSSSNSPLEVVLFDPLVDGRSAGEGIGNSALAVKMLVCHRSQPTVKVLDLQYNLYRKVQNVLIISID
jgi:hypothetical protein